VYIGIIAIKRRLINEKGNELDDEIEMATIVLIGQENAYKHGSVVGHKVHDHGRQEYDMKLYRSYFCNRSTYPGKFCRELGGSGENWSYLHTAVIRYGRR
jgi:hypothetical protein